jgi:hypothetical protein
MASPSRHTPPGSRGRTARVAHLADDLVRDAVVLCDLLLEGAQPLGDEAFDRVEQLVQGVLIERHRSAFPGSCLSALACAILTA